MGQVYEGNDNVRRLSHGKLTISHGRLTALPVTQCTPLAWPVQDVTTGTAVVVGPGVVGGGLVCTLHTQQHHISCSRMQQLAAQGCLQAEADVLICASAASPSCNVQLVSMLVLLLCQTHICTE